MKRYSLILCLVFIVSLSGVASAQIVLGPHPAATGGATIYYETSGGAVITSWYYNSYDPWVGGLADSGTSGGVAFSFYYVAHGVFEFNLQGGTTTLPTVGMTANNFTARLGGLTVTYSSATGAMNALDVDLFDMGDGTEDGVLDVYDFNSTLGSRIARRTHNFGGAPADFDDIDVTDAVRNDLFGAGQTNFSGFILKPNVNAQEKWVIYDRDTPTLTINPGVSPPIDLRLARP